MALILAVDPGGSQSPALALLARELQGHELMAADSCATAIAAVNRRVPDLLLLPPEPADGQAELLSRLRAVPNGVRTLTLPLMENGQPPAGSSRTFADQIRVCLAARPGRAELIAAGFALARWIRARRATWTEKGTGVVSTPATPVKKTPVPVFAPARVAAAAAPAAIPAIPSPRRLPPVEAESFDEPGSEAEPVPAGPSLGSRVADAASEWREPIAQWMPRIAAVAALVALVAAGFTYGPKLFSSVTNGVVVLESGPAGSQVFIDGGLAGTTPMSAELPPGRHTFEFRNGPMTRTTQVMVTARARFVERVDWASKATGSLQVESEPTGARVLVDNQVRGTTPLSVEKLSIGPHDVTMESKAGTVRRTVTIVDGQTAELHESIVAGTLAVFSPFDVQISEGNAQIRLDERGRSMLSAGTHKLRFQNRAFGYDEVRAIEIKPGETTALNLAPQTTFGVSASEPAEVWIDGARIGDTPLSGKRINIGTRMVVVKTAAGNERRFTVTATAKPVQLDVDFSKPQ